MCAFASSTSFIKESGWMFLRLSSARPRRAFLAFPRCWRVRPFCCFIIPLTSCLKEDFAKVKRKHIGRY
jgi:hypothetical protein